MSDFMKFTFSCYEITNNRVGVYFLTKIVSLKAREPTMFFN